MSFVSTSGAFAIKKNIGSGIPGQENNYIIQITDSLFTLNNVEVLDNAWYINGKSGPFGVNFNFFKISQDYYPNIIVNQIGANYTPTVESKYIPITLDKTNKTFYNGKNIEILGPPRIIHTEMIKLDKDCNFNFQYLNDSVILNRTTNAEITTTSIVANNNIYYGIGIFNNKPNATADSYKHFFTKFTGTTKNNTYYFGPNTLPQITNGSLTGLEDQIEYTSDGNIIFKIDYLTFNGLNQRIYLGKINTGNNTIIWSKQQFMPNSRTFVSKFTTVNDQIYLGKLLLGGTSPPFQLSLQKYDNNGNFTSSKIISNVAFNNFDITNDGSNIIMVAGQTSSFNNYLYSFDGNLNLNFSRRLNVGNTTGVNYNTGMAINYNSNTVGFTLGNLFITLPSDGNIPGNGTYTIGTRTLTYSNIATTLTNESPLIASYTMSLISVNNTAYFSNVGSATGTGNYQVAIL